jgi:hypothetical protein
MKRKDFDAMQLVAPAAGEVDTCPLCGRMIPASQRDRHHLVPRVKGGKETELLHRICHRQIHAIFSEAELARRYNTVESLLSNEQIRMFVDWVRKKPDEFMDSAKQSRRRR